MVKPQVQPLIDKILRETPDLVVVPKHKKDKRIAKILELFIKYQLKKLYFE